MTLKRGDVVVVRYPFASGIGSKARPALVVQCDRNNRRLANVILVAITTTIHRSGEPTQLFIAVAIPAGQQSGLVKDSVVTCENLVTVAQDRVTRKIGSLPDDLLAQINDCLKASLAIT